MRPTSPLDPSASADRSARLANLRLACLLAAAILALSGVGAASAQPEPEETAPAEELKNTIRWATASEVDNFGFDVLRGESEDGPFETLNEQPIEGGGTTDSPRKYQYVDRTIDPHKVYYYYVESIALDGTREQFTPIAKVGPKAPTTKKDPG